MVGRVHEVVLENFKSYEGRVAVGPFLKFTCVVGPNGAGKSNLMDAISFVLGVRTRHLRSERLQDLVHRKEGEDQHLSTSRPCSVELVYLETDISEVGSSSDRRITFRRVIQPTSEARFQVDGQNVAMEEYLHRLEAINILSKARNFLVFQGDVEAAAQRQGKDLTSFFEQVSGSLAFRDEYEKLALEKAQAEDKARNLFTRKRTVLNEKKQLVQQKEEAVRYQTLESERRSVQAQYYLFRLFSVAHQVQELVGSSTEIETERIQQQAVVNASRQKLDEAERERAQARMINTQTDRALTNARTQLERITPQQIQVKSQLEATRLRVQDLSQHTEHDVRRRRQLEDQVCSIRQELSKLEAELPTVTEKSRRELPFTSHQHTMFRKAQEEAERITAVDSQKVRDLESQIRSTAKERAMTERDYREAFARANHLRQKVEDLIQAENCAGSSLQRDSVLAEQTMAKLEVLQAGSRAHSQEKQQLVSERQQIMQEIQDITATEKQIEYEKRLTHVSAELAQLVPGVHGRVVRLCEPVSKRLRVAVNVALSGYLDAVITDTVKSARQCIQHLKERMLDPLTFVPLDNLRCATADARVTEALRGHHSLRPALSCISFDPTLGRAFEFMLGDIVIADSLEEGRRFAFSELRSKGLSCRIVTLQGETISRDGNLAVNSDAARQGATRFDFAAMDSTRARLEAIDAKLYELQSKFVSGDTGLAAVQDETKRLDARVLESQLSIERIRSEKSVREQEHQNAEKTWSEQQPRAERLAEEEARLRDEQRRIEGRIGTAVAQNFAALSAAMGVADVRSLEREFVRAKEAALFRENEINQQIGALQAELSMVQQSLQERIARDSGKTLEAAEADMVSLGLLHQKHSDEVKALKEQVETLSAMLQSHQDAERVEDQVVNRIRQGLKEQQLSLAEVDRRVASFEADFRNLRDARADLLRQSFLEGIELPFLRGGGRAALQKMAAAITRAGPGQSPQRADPTAEFEVDFSKLPDEKKAAATGGPATAMLEAEYRNELRRLDNELEQLRPNLKAIEQLAEAEDQAMDAEYDAQLARKRIEAIHVRFETVRVARRERFMNCFNKVKDEIQTVYKRLTTPSAPGFDGGTAFLDLEDLEDPWTGGIKFTAMPPSKRFSDISLLSGGEKTLAAMALLFAMQAFQRPPFLVLDEIDAYLDHANVQALASFIAEFDCQAIVISQKERLYCRGEGLVGVSKDRRTGSSVTFTMDLARFRASAASEMAARSVEVVCY